MTELNKCPLCGNEPDLTVFSDCISTVVCECGLAVDVGATNGDAAINGWNDVTANFTQPVKTLRDEFAMAVLSGLLASGEYSKDYDLARATRLSFRYAELMLEERENYASNN